MNENMNTEMSLLDLVKNRPARICGFTGEDEHDQTRLREIGFAEGDLVEILHVGIFGRSPLNVKLHGTTIAMRPNIAKTIRVIPADLHREVSHDEVGEIEVDVNLPCCEACGNE